jgi:hypothetical protein
MSNGLDLALMKDPRGEWSPAEGDRHTDIEFEDFEWGSFFFKTLGVAETPYIKGESFQSFEARRIESFCSSLKDYPLLARIHEFYKDAHFAAEEVPTLEAELNRVRELPMDNRAQNFLNGMLKGCELAKAERLGIRLLSS